MIELSLEVLFVLFIVGLMAGWIDTLAGGGGLLTLPALLLAGLPPAAALATNKLQSSAGTLTATIYFLRSKTLSLRDNIKTVLYVACGSTLGTALALTLDAQLLVQFIPVALIAIGIYFLFFSKKLDETSDAKQSACSYRHTTAPSLGFYDGFLGPGTGSLMSTSLVVLRGFTITKATAHAKLYNFTSNISSLLYFVLFGEIAWQIGGVMIVGQACGAALGAKTAITGGGRIIRPLTILVCFTMSARLLYTSFIA